MDRSPVRDFIVGLFVLAGLCAIAYLSISVGGFHWNGHGDLKLYANFDETGDLAERARVVISGVRVGEVTKITLDKDFRARVEMNLDPHLKLATETQASIVTAGIIGDRYIELDPGNNDENFKSGDRITNTHSAMILEKLLGQLVYGVTKGDAKENTSAPATGAGK